MGWLEGLLTGYANRHYEIGREKMREAELAADREERVFNTLLNSQYKDIQDYAAAGILDLSNPRRRKGGVAGWMGEIEQTPYLDMIRRTRERLAEDPEYAEANLRRTYYPWLGQGGARGVEQGGTPPTTPSIPTPAGQVAPAASPQGSAALPSTAVTTGGPMTPPTPPPTPAQPPAAQPAAAPQPGAPPRYSGVGTLPQG